MGLGVFATQFIPRGTIVYAFDPLEHMIAPEKFATMPEVIRTAVDIYSYIGPDGTRILSWDSAKYVNHRCECNTLSTGWGFEIAVDDILPGQEVTDDYGLFNLERPMVLACACAACRQIVRSDDFERCAHLWDARVRSAMADLNEVPQPLWDLLDEQTRRELEQFLDGSGAYRSVSLLRRQSVA
jgi:hypothetical protein